MRAIVTGGTGFIGSSLLRELAARDWSVHHTTRRPSSLPGAIELGDPSQFAEAVARLRPDVIFHLATHYLRSHSTTDIPALIAANIEFGTHVLDAAATEGVPVVNASSFFQYEHGHPRPLSLYASMKQALLTVGLYYRTERGLDLRNVVLYDTYGPADPRDKLVPLLIERTRSGAPLSLGSPRQLINLTYVDDVVEGLIAAASPDADADLTIRSERPVPVGDVVETLKAVTGLAPSITFDPGAPTSTRVLEAGDWPSPPGWRQRVGLEEGLRRSWNGS